MEFEFAKNVKKQSKFELIEALFFLKNLIFTLFS